MATSAHAQNQTYPVEGGVTLKARTYTDHLDSRYDLSIAKTPDDGLKWDFTLDYRPSDHMKGTFGAFHPTSYADDKTTILRATLHQYEVHEERVTFKGLDIGPTQVANSNNYPMFFGPGSPARFLQLAQPQTIVTPSGISVTLPAQGAQTARDFIRDFNGNVDALFLKVNVSPDEREVTLPNSPLYKRFPKPVSIKLETPEPNLMVYYMADNTFKTLKIGLPNLTTTARLDSLTLILRQRVELQTIPVAIEVPVERPVKAK